jgi:hypothetical protein
VRRQENAHPCGWERVYRPVWWSLTVLLGTAGIAGGVLVLGPGGTLVLVAGSAALATLGVWQFGPQHGEGGPGRYATALGTACAFGLLALIGLSCEVGLAGFACGVLVGAAGWPLRRRRPSAAGPSRERTGPEHPRVPRWSSSPRTPCPGRPGCARSAPRSSAGSGGSATCAWAGSPAPATWNPSPTSGVAASTSSNAATRSPSVAGSRLHGRPATRRATSAESRSDELSSTSPPVARIRARLASRGPRRRHVAGLGMVCAGLDPACGRRTLPRVQGRTAGPRSR